MSVHPLVEFERTIDRAQASDLAGIRWLLATERMPSSHVTPESVDQFLVCRDELGAIAIVGVERIGDVGLLRSLVVTIPHGGCGIGHQMVQEAETLASQLGLHSLFVITTWERKFFEQQGFRRVGCDRAPPEIQSRFRAESSTVFLMVKP